MDNLNEILKESGLTGKELSGLLGLTYGSYRSSLSDGRRKRFPKWAKAFMIGFELGRDNTEKKSDPSGVGNYELRAGRADSDADGRDSMFDCEECVYEVLKGGECIVMIPCPEHIGGFNECFKKK